MNLKKIAKRFRKHSSPTVTYLFQKLSQLSSSLHTNNTRLP